MKVTSGLTMLMAFCSLEGMLREAERHFRKAIERLTRKNPNPYDSEAYYLLGVALFYQSKNDEAFDAF